MPAIVPKGRLAMCQAMVRRNCGTSGGPEPRVEMVAIDIELTDDLGREMRLRSRLEDKHRPERVGTARGGSAHREPLQHSDCLGDGFNRDPFRRLPLARLALVGDRANAMPFDDAVRA